MTLELLLQTAPGTGSPSPGASAIQSFLPMILIVVLFYFLLLAPMRKQQKKTREMLSNLKKGDQVVTSGGLFGSVASIEDQIVWLKLTDQVKVKVARSAITGLVTDGQAPPQS
jgi:preprotein translocase subunit YajC